MVSIGSNQRNNSIVKIPTPGGNPLTVEWVESMTNSSTGIVTFGLFQSVRQTGWLIWGDNDGFAIAYGQYNNGVGIVPFIGYAPESPNQATCVTYNCPTTLNYYTFNEATGEPAPTTPFKSASYPTAQRPWFWPASITPGTSYSLFYSTFAIANLITISAAYSSRVVSSTFTEYKVASTQIMTPYLSEELAALNAGSLTNTGYAMTTENPTGLLIATTANLKLNITTYAVQSENTAIRTSAQYIMDNHITEDTSGYVDSLGCYLVVKFLSYGSATPVAIPPPASANLPSSATYECYPTTGIKWTIVSCDMQPNPTTTYTTDDEGDDEGDNGGEGEGVRRHGSVFKQSQHDRRCRCRCRSQW